MELLATRSASYYGAGSKRMPMGLWSLGEPGGLTSVVVVTLTRRSRDPLPLADWVAPVNAHASSHASHRVTYLTRQVSPSGRETWHNLMCSPFNGKMLLTWAAGDMQARGFLLGGTSGRTTLTFFSIASSLCN